MKAWAFRDEILSLLRVVLFFASCSAGLWGLVLAVTGPGLLLLGTRPTMFNVVGTVFGAPVFRLAFRLAEPVHWKKDGMLLALSASGSVVLIGDRPSARVSWVSVAAACITALQILWRLAVPPAFRTKARGAAA